VVGGDVDLDDLYVTPTVLLDVGWDSPIMQDTPSTNVNELSSPG
jgi:hypothetical protein